MNKLGSQYAVWSTPRVEVGDRVKVGEELFIVFYAEPCWNPPDMAFIKFWRLS